MSLSDDVFASLPTLCATQILPANAIISFGDGREPLILGEDAVFQAPCPVLAPRQEDDYDSSLSESSLGSADANGDRQSNFRDPFYATQFPMCYALAATTVTAYMLVIMLFVTPRSFLDGGVTYLGRRGFTNRGFTNSSPNGVTIGGRPWLQKVAALTVAISLTVATADTFRVAKQQYVWGIQNAKALQDEVLGSTELKVIRLISDTFLWLAQAQTLIRLFPRQREKIIIKWAAFALITLDVIFTALNSFLYADDGLTRGGEPHGFAHPVPALSYLFQLALGILYAAWVIYYSIMKKRYAFYHPSMKNICLVAIISVTAVIIPVVFFILDISEPEFTGWGDYVRWVGAAAASVVVWEWVERIEALEREEKKDGILGREVFDGDDTIEVNASDYPWQRRNRLRKKDGEEDGQGGLPNENDWPGISTITERYRRLNNNNRNNNNSHSNNNSTNNGGGNDGNAHQPTTAVGNILRPVWPARPAPAITPVSRTDTASATSTVYQVRYQAASDATRTPDPLSQHSMLDLTRQSSIPRSQHTSEDTGPTSQGPMPPMQNGLVIVPAPRRSQDDGHGTANNGWRTLMPIVEPVPSRGQHEEQSNSEASVQAPQAETRFAPRARQGNRWDLKARLEEFAANQAERIRERIRPTTGGENLPVTVIPAPARRGAALQQVLEEEELNTADNRGSSGGDGQQDSNGSSGQMVQLDRSRSTFSGTSRGPDAPIPPSNPPLWPGVQSHYDEYDEYSYDGDSVTDSVSTDHQRRGSDDVPGTTRTA